jgi:hypothetical protein
MKQLIFTVTFCAGCIGLSGCGAPAGNVNVANANTNISNSFANTSNISNLNTNSAASTSTIEANEPDRYAATVKLALEALGEQQKATLPTVAAQVARNGEDRRMEFALPNGEKVVYLDTAGMNYLILPNRRQYAELTKESVGFEVRRLLMPEQIVDQVKGLQGVRRVGEETINGRRVVKYAYTATANTQTQAGQVDTESFLLIDAETGLPLRSETVSQAQGGGNVQGYKGMRLVTEMTDIRLDPDPSLFAVPTDYAKIDAEQVKAQAGLIFNAVAALVGQAMQQQQQPAPATSPSPMR